ncbi:MAG TPA: hypothetical protein DD490_21735 [Acidobacteria bacterium]|nr:hypothetical protein [Acidobacteriota bacterium]
MSSRLTLLVALALLSLAVPGAAKVIRVPQDVRDLQAAIGAVQEGDVIELKAGTYTAPSAGFSIQNKGKAFTIRAAQGAAVILDGKGKARIVRFKNGNRSRGKRVTFERLVFQNGMSTTEGDAGAVTLSAAEARFVDCQFLNNAASGRTTGGGAVRAVAASDATFVRTLFRGNSSKNRGGAVEIIGSAVAVEGGSFVENRTNPAGHRATSPGGAIYVLDGVLRVSDALFERNQAGWVGGAIYAFGKWTEPVTTPASEVTVVRSTFRDNQTCCTANGQGGAIHIEDQATLRLQQSRLLGNRAKLGGGLDVYRAIAEVTASLFQGNRALEGTAPGSGGAIFAASNEFSFDGAVNRRTASLTVTDSLLQGGIAEGAAHSGGCITAGGDVSRAYGDNGVSQMGTLEENRARVEIRRSAFVDCDVVSQTAGSGFGGGLKADLVNLLLEDSLFMDSDARGTTAGGGGLALQDESVAAITRTTFVRNSAQHSGGALHLSGSVAQVSRCNFFGNDVQPGVGEALNQSRGAALFAIPLLSTQRPERARNVGGLVTESLFSQNTGLAVWDVDPASGPINDVRYDKNQLFEATFGDKVYFNSLVEPAGASVATLNRLTVSRGSRGTTDKSAVDNVRLFSAPVAGTLLAAPSLVATGAPASGETLLHYAWSGRAATLNGQALSSRHGQVVAGPGTHTLVVDGTQVAAVVLPAARCPAGAACLAGGRFQVRIPGAHLLAQEVDTAYFSLKGGGTFAVQVRHDTKWHAWFVQGVSNVSHLSDLSRHSVEISDTVSGTVHVWSDLAPAEESGADPVVLSDLPPPG